DHARRVAEIAVRPVEDHVAHARIADPVLRMAVRHEYVLDGQRLRADRRDAALEGRPVLPEIRCDDRDAHGGGSTGRVKFSYRPGLLCCPRSRWLPGAPARARAPAQG